jgi:Methyltransferase domain
MHDIINSQTRRYAATTEHRSGKKGTSMFKPREIKDRVNGFLKPLNVRIATLTAEQQEHSRLLKLEAAGHFVEPAFPLLKPFANCDPSEILVTVKRFKRETDQFLEAKGNRYSYANDYFTSPDAEVAYAVLRNIKPRYLIEVGSGNSTQLFREAINDGALGTKIVSIDPTPRKDISSAADTIIEKRLEAVSADWISETLGSDGILFIDSSHVVRAGNDVTSLFLNVIPGLKNGAVIHIHDIFLPFEYPRDWLVLNQWDWNEQYLVQAMLQGSDQFEVLWAGHFFQRTWPTFETHFTFTPKRGGTASSLWLRKLA